MKLAVYGTLKKKHHANRLLKNSKLLEEKFISGFDMFSVSGSFPAVVHGDGRIWVEVYDVPEEVMPRLIAYESGMYDLEAVENFHMFVWKGSTTRLSPILNGIW